MGRSAIWLSGEDRIGFQMAGRFPTILCILGAVASSPAMAKETPESFRADYAITYLGLTVARSSFTSRISNSSFEVNGSLKSAGIAEIFDSTRGTTSTSGRFGGQGTRPEAFLANYTYGKKAKKIAISFANGRVTKTENVPPLKNRSDGWVAVEPGHLKAVADPLSATLVRADGADAVCKRTLHVYDGEMRADLALTHVSTDTMSVPGYEGEVVTCGARFLPVSGYREGKYAIEFLKNKSKIRITFAPLGRTGIYAPIRATVGTQIGTITISARRFETLE